MKNDGKPQTRSSTKPDKPNSRYPDRKRRDTPDSDGKRRDSLVESGARLITRLAQVFGTVPAPRITSPSPGAAVMPGAALDVSIETNCPDLPHELLLFAASNTSSPIAFTEISDATAGPFKIDIPADSDGNPTDYYLEVGIPPGIALEQERHRIQITTEPPLLSLSAVSGDPPPGSYQLTDAGVRVEFDVAVSGTDGLSHFTWTFDDGSTATTKRATHIYTTDGDFVVTISVKAGDQEVIGTIGPYKITR